MEEQNGFIYNILYISEKKNATKTKITFKIYVVLT